VNVGDRQHGRLRADSVIDTAPEGDDVFSAIALALTPEFVRKSEQQLAPYGSGGASRRIVQILRNVSLSRLLEKSFRDCGPGCDSWTALEGGFNDD
jgi:UDP-N-acetylglucosamine 2-epimerase